MENNIDKVQQNNIDKVQLIDFTKCGKSEDELIAIEYGKNIPFDIKRIFYIYDSEENVVRGQHANKKSQFVLINLMGRSKIRVMDGKGNQKTFCLDQPTQGIYLPPMVWREMYDFSDDCVLLCLADTYYDGMEYIRNYDEFCKEVRTEAGMFDKGL